MRHVPRLFQRLTDDETTTMKTALKKLSTELFVPGLGITNEEKIQIVQAIGLRQGHWYKCPNGETRDKHLCFFIAAT